MLVSGLDIYSFKLSPKREEGHDTVKERRRIVVCYEQ